MGFKKRWGLETSDHVLSLAWSENMLIVTPSTGIVLMVDQDGKTIAGFAAHGLGNGAAAARSDILATCGFDGRIQIYEIGDSKISPARVIALGKGWIERVRWSPDCSRLASALGKTLVHPKAKWRNCGHLFESSNFGLRLLMESKESPRDRERLRRRRPDVANRGDRTLRPIRLGRSESSRLVEP